MTSPLTALRSTLRVTLRRPDLIATPRRFSGLRPHHEPSACEPFPLGLPSTDQGTAGGVGDGFHSDTGLSNPERDGLAVNGENL